MKHNGVAVPACQSERNEAFTRAVWAGDAKTAAALAGAALPEDAMEGERGRWRKRRSRGPRTLRGDGALPGQPFDGGAGASR